MAHFLLIYDRATGSLIREQRFDASSLALKARFTAEAEFSGRPEVEIVALSAASETDLRRTHARYFSSLDELAARMG